jgi:ribosomal protein S7
MSVAEIQRAVESIKEVPSEERIRVSRWAMAEIEPEAAYAVFDQGFAAGYYNEVMAQTDEDRRKGRALDRIY